MGFNQIVKSFVPQDKIFYSIFENMGDTLTKMVKNYQKALIEPSLIDRNNYLNSLEKHEHFNDELTHSIFVELSKNFITPFDREDIYALAKSLDDIADYMHSSSKRMMLYKINEADDYMIKFVDIMEESIHQLSKAIVELRSMKNIRRVAEACVEINSLEGKADKLYDDAISNLFDSDKTTLEIVKLKDIYEEMEIVTDKCEDAADILESIIIKYA